MNRRYKIIGLALLVIGAVALAAWQLGNMQFAVLDPAGQIADKERNLMVFATLLSLIVVIPVFAITGFIVWRYREGNTKAKYSPDWDGSRLLESIWWGVPLVLMVVLSVVTWQSSHDLDPFKPVSSSTKPLKIQVVALQWKWLFIYPEQRIASVNYVQFPVNTPLNFEITADAPMNSFWIPRLGGQMYAMSGMSTQLHLLADRTGSFDGSSANISGEGFAGMKFTAKSTSDLEFKNWVNQVKQSPDRLNLAAYRDLAKPTEDEPPALFTSAEPDLYAEILMKYMLPGQALSDQPVAQHNHHEESE